MLTLATAIRVIAVAPARPSLTKTGITVAPAPIAPDELVAVVLDAFVEVAFDRLGRHRPWLEWMAEREEWANKPNRPRKPPYPRYDGPLDPQRNAGTDLKRRVLFDRDGHRCRWCGMPVVPTATFSAHGLLHGKDPIVGPDGLRVLGGTDGTKHVVLFALRAMDGHRKPYSRGGRTDEDNLLTACALCNYQVRDTVRGDPLDLEELPIEHLVGWPR